MTGQKRIADDELLITRTFDAPPSVVFALWSSAEHMKRWMGPRNFTCPEAMIDFRVGGAYRAMIRSDEHGESRFSGVYREIVANERLVFTFTWEGEGRETLVTITLQGRDGKTVQTFHQAPFDNIGRRDSHVGGWNEAFDKEAVYSEKIAKEQGV